MITQEQLDRLKSLYKHTWDKATADALAAAIATIEGLPVTADEARLTIGDPYWWNNWRKPGDVSIDKGTIECITPDDDNYDLIYATSDNARIAAERRAAAARGEVEGG